MTGEDTRREFIRKYGSVGAFAGFSSPADAHRLGQFPEGSIQPDENRVLSQSSNLSVTFGKYHVVVDGNEYGRVGLDFWDGQSETFAGGFQGTTVISHSGYRGTGDVIPEKDNGELDLASVPDSPPADETYGEFHGPITRVAIETDGSNQEFSRPNSPECVTGVEFDCSTVTFDYQTEPTDLDIVLVYGDGSYLQFREFGGLDGYQPLGDTILSDQSLDRVYLQHQLTGGMYVFPNPDTDCSPTGSRVATFDCTQVTIESGLVPADALQFFPGVSLIFTDGSRQEVEPEGSYPMTFSGRGQHANKPIRAFRLYGSPWGGIIRFLVNPSADDCARGGDSDPGGTLLEIVSTEEGEYRYEVVVRGDVEKTRVSERIASQANDEIERRDDGTVVITGYTGNPGYGDAFRIDGEIVDFEHVGGDADAVVRVDGEEVPVDELGSSGDSDSDNPDPDPSVFAVISTEEGEVSYRVLVDGTVEKTSISEKVTSQDNDEINERDDGRVVVEGYTGNPGYGDAFEVTGEIVSFERTGGDADVRLELDGEDVTDQYLDGE